MSFFELNGERLEDDTERIKIIAWHFCDWLWQWHRSLICHGSIPPLLFAHHSSLRSDIREAISFVEQETGDKKRAAHFRWLCQEFMSCGESLSNTLSQNRRTKQVEYDYFIATFSAIIQALMKLVEPVDSVRSVAYTQSMG